MRVLVTGGAGFIGSHLVRACADEGAHVVCYDNLTEGREENCNGAELIVGDVTDGPTLFEALDGVDVVYHLAAVRSVARSVEDPVGTDRVNASGTLRVLETARRCGVRRVVVTSSSSVYGGIAPVPTDEFASVAPRSPYAASKLAGEHYADVYRHLYGLETVVLRPFNVFGPRQRPDSPYSGVISLLIDALLAGRKPIIHGDGTQSRDFTYVDDAVQVFRLAGTEPYHRLTSRVYNVGAGQETTLNEIWDLLQEIEGRQCRADFGPARPGDVPRSRANITRARSELGYTPTVELRDGLQRTIEWVRSGT